MDKIRGDLGERAEDEFALVQPRMGNDEKLAVDVCIAEKENVEIDRSRLIKRFVTASEKVLDPHQTCQHLRGTYVVNANLGDHIQERCLAFDLDGFGLVNGGQFVDDKARLHQRTNGHKQIARSIAQI